MARVLVVDDCNDTIASLSNLLRLLGHDVRAASTDSSALAVASDFQPDAILVDVSPALDGYDLARQLRSIRGLDGILIIAMSGDAGIHGRRTPTGDFDLHLVKPVDARDLARLLNDTGSFAI